MQRAACQKQRNHEIGQFHFDLRLSEGTKHNKRTREILNDRRERFSKSSHRGGLLTEVIEKELPFALWSSGRRPLAQLSHNGVQAVPPIYSKRPPKRLRSNFHPKTAKGYATVCFRSQEDCGPVVQPMHSEVVEDHFRSTRNHGLNLFAGICKNPQLGDANTADIFH